MSSFKNNFSELLMLAGENVIFTKEDDNSFKFELIPVSLKNVLFNDELGALLSILGEEVEKLQKMVPGIEIKDHFNFVRVICVLGSKKEEVKKLSRSIIEGLKTLIPEMVFEGQFFRIREEMVTQDLFESIMEVVHKILGKERTVILDSDDEFTRMEKKAKLRAEKIRKNKKQNKEDTKFEDILAALIYEYPQYKLKDLFELNMYAFNYLNKYIGKIANYEVSKIAAGNGLTKKHKYFIEK